MNNYITLRLTLTILFVSLLFTNNKAYSQSYSQGFAGFKDGMTQEEVIAIIGSPIERRENEVRREHILVYSNSKFLFKEGGLVLPKKEGAIQDAKKKLAINYNEYINNSLNSKPEFSDTEVRDIFEKISNEGGAPDTAPGTGAVNPGVPQMAPPLRE